MQFKRFKRFRTWVREEFKDLRVIAESVTARFHQCHHRVDNLKDQLDEEIEELANRVDHLEVIIKRSHEALDWERGRVIRRSCSNSLGLKDSAGSSDCLSSGAGPAKDSVGGGGK